jgi:hypothetical protein
LISTGKICLFGRALIPLLARYLASATTHTFRSIY